MSVSVAKRLGGFVLLVAVIFLVAFFVGTRVGPVTPVHGKGGGPGMRMSVLLPHALPGQGLGSEAAR
jgi:hypothetical protein